MKVYDSNNLRNIAILGHSGCGKTNLIEAIAFAIIIFIGTKEVVEFLLYLLQHLQ